MKRRREKVPRSRFRFPLIELVSSLDDGVMVVVNGKVSFTCSTIRLLRFFGKRGRQVDVLMVRRVKKGGGFLYSTSLNGRAPRPDDWYSKPFSQIDIEGGVAWIDEDGRRTAFFPWPKA